MKLLLYCTKAKPELYNTDKGFVLTDFGIGEYYKDNVLLNGTIVAECDFEVEKIYYSPLFCNYTTWSLGKDELLNKSCLTHNEIKNYLGTKDVIGNDGYNGYAIYIKNLHIFDEPYELRNALIYNFNNQYIVEKAPQNMMKVYNRAGECHILISIQPQWLCKILNGEKTIEVRKKVLKEMIK